MSIGVETYRVLTEKLVDETRWTQVHEAEFRDYYTARDYYNKAKPEEEGSYRLKLTRYYTLNERQVSVEVKKKAGRSRRTKPTE